MLGYTQNEIAKALPDEYRRLAINSQAFGLFYSDAHRHALFTRHGVVFQQIANVSEQDALFVWLEQRDRMDDAKRDLRTLLVDSRAWTAVLTEDVLTPSAGQMFEALRAITAAATDDFGRLRKITPAGLRDTLGEMLGVYYEVREDVREATRALRASLSAQERDDILTGTLTVPRDVVDEALHQTREEPATCDAPFFIKGECTGCGRPFHAHPSGKPSGAKSILAPREA